MVMDGPYMKPLDPATASLWNNLKVVCIVAKHFQFHNHAEESTGNLIAHGRYSNNSALIILCNLHTF